MVSEVCARAIQDSLKNKKALLKVISANDVGLTGAHQYGFYLPKEVWPLFSSRGPVRGENHKRAVTINWHDGRQTNSTITWYGEGTRSEYRLTGFGRGFPHLSKDYVGNLLILVPVGEHDFNAYVLHSDDDIAEIQAALGAEIPKSWAAYEEGVTPRETEDACLKRAFDEFASSVKQLPKGIRFSTATHDAILACVPEFAKNGLDGQLIRLMREEYNLYRLVERKVFQSEITQVFSSIDAFLDTAQSILQTRKTRAGRSLENHVQRLLQREGLRFQMRQVLDDTRPDIIIPGKAEYEDPDYPDEKLFMVGLKTTCKDRWRQVLNEAPRMKIRHILTLQAGISGTQLNEMSRSQIVLVVPQTLHKEYPPEHRSNLLTFDKFVIGVRSALATS